MLVPGSNLFDIATTVISTDVIQYYRFIGRVVNPDSGDWIPQYDAPELRNASVQAVTKSEITRWGLDMSKQWVMIYVDGYVQDLARSVAPDRFVWNGIEWELRVKTDWSAIDGWSGALAILSEDRLIT
jgi:hypothetical protein